MDFGRVERLVFCCKGNICRSAYAHWRAREQGWATASFGLDARPGKPANPAAVAAAQRRGLSLDAHAACDAPTALAQAGPGDLILAMEPGQLQALRGRSAAQLSLLGLWHPTRPRPYLQDPYGRGPGYFDFCFGYIDACLSGLAAHAAASGRPAPPPTD